MDGVLCDYDFEKRMALLERDLGVPGAAIRARIFDSGFEDEADLGKYSSDDYVAGISERLGVPVTTDAWIAARRAAMTPDPAMLDLARSLGARVETAMLTNNGRLLAERIGDVFPEVLDVFGERTFFSAVIGMGKEHTPTFPAFARKMGWDLDGMLFVDDSARYIAAARDAGVRAHHFKGIDGLRAELAKGGLG